MHHLSPYSDYSYLDKIMPMITMLRCLLLPLNHVSPRSPLYLRVSSVSAFAIASPLSSSTVFHRSPPFACPLSFSGLTHCPIALPPPSCPKAQPPPTGAIMRLHSRHSRTSADSVEEDFVMGAHHREIFDSSCFFYGRAHR